MRWAVRLGVGLALSLGACYQSPGETGSGEGSGSGDGGSDGGGGESDGGGSGGTDDDRPETDPDLECTGLEADPGETIVSRLTRWEYINTIRDLFGVDVADLTEPLPHEVRAPLSTTSIAQSVDIKHAEVYSNVAQRVAGELGNFAGQYTSCTDFGESCQREFIENLGELIFRRPVRDDEVTRYLAIFDVVQEEGDGFDTAAGLVLQSLLQSPQFLYHLEDQRGTGLLTLGDYAIASRLSYLIWQSTPDEALYEAAASGALQDEAQIEEQVIRMVQDPRARVAAQVFVEDWVDLSRLERAVSGIDEGLKAQMRGEAERLVEAVFWEDSGGLVDLLTAEKTYATPDLAELYGIPAQGDDFQPYDLSGVPERRGLLTQAAILATTANGNRPTIVSRGLFVLRTILCRDVPDPPAGVDTNESSLPEDASERDKSAERMERGTCGPCHGAFDPLAYGFDRYDGTGRHRLMDDYGHSLAADGWIPPEPGQPATEPRGQRHDYEDVDQLLDLLASLPFVQSCLAEKPLMFSLRRELDGGAQDDACLVQTIRQKAEMRGGSYVDLLTAIATHPMFRSIRAG